MATGKLYEFIEYLNNEVKNGSIYVWGGQGEKPTPDKIRRMETNQTNINRALNLYNKRKDKYPNMKMFDCSGLGVYWLYNLKHIISGDMNAHMLMGACRTLAKSQLKKGDFVFRVKNGNAYHIGYVVNDNLDVIEAKGRDDGVVKNGINAFGSSYWNAFGRPEKYFPELASKTPSSATNPISTEYKQGSWSCARLLKLTSPYTKGEDVTCLQKALAIKGFPCGSTGADGVFGQGTEASVKSFQKKNGLEADGKAGKNTITALGGKWLGV